MKLLIVTSSYPAGPSDVAAPFAPPLVRELRRRGNQVAVLALDRGQHPIVPEAGVQWFGGGLSGGSLSDTRLFSLRGLGGVPRLLVQGERALAASVRAERPDICLALWAVPAGYLAWRIKSRLGVPYAVWSLGSDINSFAAKPLVGRLIRPILRGARHRFADGIALSERVEEISGLDCHFLPTARPLPEPKPMRLAGSPPHFLFVGRFEPVKGVDILVDAWRIAKSRGIGGHLSIVGSGSLSDTVQRSVAAAGLAETVSLLPVADAEEVAGYMAAADCLVVPSRSESIPLVFSEAVQSALPLIVSEAGDMGRLARENGLSAPVPIGDPARLAAAMIAFANDPAEARQRMAAAAAQLKPMFDIAESAGRLQAVLERR